MKPPIKGARRGPRNTVLAKIAIAMPRVWLSNISAKTAATTVSGQLPKTPEKKRVIMTVCRSLAVATAVPKILNPNMLMRIGKRRPLSSENGAQIKGPKA